MRRLVVLTALLALLIPGCVQAKDEGPKSIGSEQDANVGVASDTLQGNVDLPRYPSVSPDGSQIAFTWRGDLWRSPTAGGHAVRLTRHPGEELRSCWSPDGKRIVFEADRDGYLNLYTMNADGTDVRQVSVTDSACRLSAFTRNAEGEEVLLFDSYREADQYSAPRPYYISTKGGDIHRLHDAFGSYPVLSPDKKKLAFTRGTSRDTRRHYRGPDDRDVWTYDYETGSFKQLTKWEGNDDRAQWLDGETLLYISDREFNCANLYRMSAKKGDKKPKRLTSFKEDDVQSFDVSADGSTVVMMVWDTVYSLDLTSSGAEPVALEITANEDEEDNFVLKSIGSEVSEAALSPDGEVMAMIAYGEVYVRNMEDDSPTRRVTTSHAREHSIAWSADGLRLFFTSDRDGTDSIYAATVHLTRSEVKEDFDKAINPPEEEEEAEEEEEKAEAAPEEEKVASAEEELAEGADKPEATESEEPKAEKKEEEAKEEDKKEKKEEEELPKELQPERWHDAMQFNIEPVIVEPTNDREPSPSLDGKYLAFRRGRGDLALLEFETGEITTLVTGWDSGLHWVWGPKSKQIAYCHSDLDFNEDIWIVPVDGSKEPVNITRHPDNDFNPCWSADGKVLAFLSERVEEEYDVWMVYLDKDLEALTPKELDEYYDEAIKAAKKREPLPVEKPKSEEEDEGEEEADGDGDAAADNAKAASDDNDANNEDEADEGADEDEADEEEEEDPLDLDDAYLRVKRITRFKGNESGLAMTPGGDRLVFNADIDGRGLFSVKWDGKERKRLGGSSSPMHVSLSGDKLVVVKGGHAGTVAPGGGKIKNVNISDKIRIDLQKQSGQKFAEAARTLGESFYHPTLKGLDWKALSKKYHALAWQSRTASEFATVGMRLMGELNGSHLGIYPPRESMENAQANGRLGTTCKRVDDGFEVLEIVPESPAAKGPMALEVGDVILAIDSKPIKATDTIESRLKGRIGDEVLLTVRRNMEDGEVKELGILMVPTSRGAISALKYKAYRLRNAELVSEWSNDRIGYIHIESMSQASLDVYERDLYAAAHGKDGLIIDVRNNGGGWTADRLLSSLMVQEHAYTVPRGADWSETGHYPQDRLFIQRYTMPANMLCNEKSFSNAEIISHAFKTLKRGKLVGQQTYGGVISTGGTSLIDGTFLRLPFRGWFVKGGMDMENNGAIPDIIVPQTPEAECAGSDEQLEAAVKDLMKRLK